ncbi:MAG: protoporphyrinogen oxidase [Acidobacteriota bacterium]
MTEWRDVIIVGAGITGLVTAYQLRQQGLNISLLERDKNVGGVMRSEQRNGFLLERGPNSFLASAEAVNLINELGLDTEFVTAPPKLPRYIFYRGALQPLPMNPLAFLFSPLLSLKGKLRIFAEPFIPAPHSNKDDSIADFFRRRLGSETHDRLVAPFVSGIYAGNTEKLSIAASFPKLAEMEAEYGSLLWGAIRSTKSAASKNEQKPGVKKHLSSFRDGLATLPCTLARHLDDALLMACVIVGITINPHSPRYQVQYQQLDQSYTLSTDTLVLVTPAMETARLLNDSLPSLAAELQAIEYAPVVLVYLSFNKQELDQRLNGFGFLAPRNEGLRLLGSVWNSSIFPGRAPQGKTLLTNFIGGAHDPEAMQLSEEKLIEIVTRELQMALRTSAPAEAIDVYKIPRAIPQYTIGHIDRVARINRLLAEQPGLHLAGNYLRGVSVPDCISRAVELAAELAISTQSARLQPIG